VLENHRELVPWLMRARPAYVFNLCDEGFCNDALKELHVPALLEMCNVAYSGAGPASLAICYDKVRSAFFFNP
jgi:D-alanine-D-alanine ligase